MEKITFSSVQIRKLNTFAFVIGIWESSEIWYQCLKISKSNRWLQTFPLYPKIYFWHTLLRIFGTHPDRFVTLVRFFAHRLAMSVKKWTDWFHQLCKIVSMHRLQRVGGRKYSNDEDSRTSRDYMECGATSTGTTASQWGWGGAILAWGGGGIT